MMAAGPATAMTACRAVGAGSGDHGTGTVSRVPDPAMVSVVPTPSHEGSGCVPDAHAEPPGA